MIRRAKETVWVMAGEPSGDWAAGQVVSRIRRRLDAEFAGVGGDSMARAGVNLVGHIDDLTAMGVKASLMRFRNWAAVWCRVRSEIVRSRPKVALLVDSPEVNLPLARILKDAGSKVVFYVGPQVWAWRAARLELLRRRVDVTALVLPFEKPLYDDAGVEAVFVGHPILDRAVPGNYDSIRGDLNVSSNEKLVAFLPGSRPLELKYHEAPMATTIGRLKGMGIRTVVVLANPQMFPDAAKRFARAGALVAPRNLGARQVLRGSDVAVVCSGTATLEAAVESTPHLIVYRTDRLSYAVGSRVVKTPFIGLSNLVAGRQVVPELLQNDVNPNRMTDEVLRLLDQENQRHLLPDLKEVTARLGSPGAEYLVAELVLERI